MACLTDYGGPNFSNNDASGWNFNGVGHHVRARVEVENLAASIFLNECLDGLGVIRNAI